LRCVTITLNTVGSIRNTKFQNKIARSEPWSTPSGLTTSPATVYTPRYSAAVNKMPQVFERLLWVRDAKAEVLLKRRDVYTRIGALLERDLSCRYAEGCGKCEENELSSHDARREKGVLVPPRYLLDQCGPFIYIYIGGVLEMGRPLR
jgi:hypothetical protein